MFSFIAVKVNNRINGMHIEFFFKPITNNYLLLMTDLTFLDFKKIITCS